MNKLAKDFIKLLLLVSIVTLALFLIGDPAVAFGVALLIWVSQISSESKK